MDNYYHVHYELNGNGVVGWFETHNNAWTFVDKLDEIGIPVGNPVGSGTKCRVCSSNRKA